MLRFLTVALLTVVAGGSATAAQPSVELGGTGPAGAVRGDTEDAGGRTQPRPAVERSAKDVIVVLGATRDSVAARASDALVERYRLSFGQRYSHVFEGFAASVPSSELAELRSDPGVAAVYPDGVARVSSQTEPSWRAEGTGGYL